MELYPHDCSYLNTDYNRNKTVEQYQREANMTEITKGICVKISTNKDQTYRIVCDIDKAYAEKINLLKWVDQEVALQCEVDND